MKINISIDDVSPHPDSSIEVLDRCYEILQDFPTAKFTLFVPTAYWRTISYTTDRPLFLHEHPAFCDVIRNLLPQNFEIGFHGRFHGVPGISNNDEFQAISRSAAKQLIELMRTDLKMAKLENKFSNILRPPAWRINAAAIMGCHDAGIKILALHPDDLYMKIYDGGIKEFPGKINFCNINPPFKDFGIFELGICTFHAPNWDKNYLSVDMSRKLRDFLKICDPQFVFMSEI